VSSATSSYAIRIAGHLDPHWAPWLGDAELAHDADGTTTITAPTVDQARLHGLLSGIRDIGATLIDLRTIDT
jgi:hypothetical protein